MAKPFNLSFVIDKPIINLNRAPVLERLRKVHLSHDEVLQQFCKLPDIENKVNIELHAIRNEFMKRLGTIDFSERNKDQVSTSIMLAFQNSEVYEYLNKFPDLKSRFDDGLMSRQQEHLTTDQIKMRRMELEIQSLRASIGKHQRYEEDEEVSEKRRRRALSRESVDSDTREKLQNVVFNNETASGSTAVYPDLPPPSQPN
ncbi:hypothetical protein DFS34DRAFT_638568, partial [Phlyctochytrium arcticum]